MPLFQPVKAGFVDKLIERIGRVGPEETRAFIERLSQEKGFLETILDAIQEGVIVTDPDGRIHYLNPAAGRLLGLSREESVGEPIAQRLRGLDWAEVAGGVVSRELEVAYPQRRTLHFYVVPLAGGAGHAVILRDITESRRHAEQAIESERIAALTLLAAGVAHEIGNPLNSLHIHLQLIERQVKKLVSKKHPSAKDHDLLHESLQIAQEEVARLDTIITQFLRALRPAPLQLRPENINAIVRESVAFLAAEIKDRDILVEQELAENLPLLEVDRDQLKQVFYNIIRNAFQAMRSQGILRIRTEQDDASVAIAFADTGGGVAAEHIGSLFEPYFTTKPDGSGLGLMIVRRIVRAHGGEVELTSNPGSGLTFTVRLPIAEPRVRLLESGRIS